MILVFLLSGNQFLLCHSIAACPEPIVAKDAETEHSSRSLPNTQQTQQASNSSKPSPPANPNRPLVIKQWTTGDVQDWLREIGLTNLCQTFDFFDGRYLQKLYKLFQQNHENEDKFKTDFNLDARSCLQFTVELETLFEKQENEISRNKHSKKRGCRIS